MILHIGAREMVSHRDIVAIIKYEGLTATKGGRAYLKAVQDRGKTLGHLRRPSRQSGGAAVRCLLPFPHIGGHPVAPAGRGRHLHPRYGLARPSLALPRREKRKGRGSAIC